MAQNRKIHELNSEAEVAQFLAENEATIAHSFAEEDEITVAVEATPHAQPIHDQDIEANEEEIKAGNALATFLSRLHHVYNVPKWVINKILNNMILNAMSSTVGIYSIPLAALILAKGWPDHEPDAVTPTLIGGMGFAILGWVKGIVDMVDPEQTVAAGPRDAYKAVLIASSTLMYALRTEIEAYVFEQKLEGKTNQEINGASSTGVFIKAFIMASAIGGAHAYVRAKSEQTEKQIKAMQALDTEDQKADHEQVLARLKLNAKAFNLIKYAFDGVLFGSFLHTFIVIGEELNGTYQPDVTDRGYRYGASLAGGLAFSLLSPLFDAKTVTRLISQLNAEGVFILLGMTYLGLTPDSNSIDDGSKNAVAITLFTLLASQILIGLALEYAHKRGIDIKNTLTEAGRQVLNLVTGNEEEQALTRRTSAARVYGGLGHFERNLLEGASAEQGLLINAGIENTSGSDNEEIVRPSFN